MRSSRSRPSATSDAFRALFLVTGPPAAGKTTVAHLLAERFARGVHVEGDVFRRFVVSGRKEMTPDPSPDAVAQLRLRYRLAAWVADGYFDAGFTVVWEDMVSEAMLQECVALLRARPVHVFSLVPAADVIAARDASRPSTGYGAWTIEELRAGFADAPHPIGVRLDTSMQTPSETVQSILARAQGRG